MTEPTGITGALGTLNSLFAGLFLLTAFGLIAARQVKDCLQLFVIQSLLLAASAFALAVAHHSWNLLGVAVVNLITKPLVIPWILRRTAPREIYTRREIDQVLNIPTSLLIALALAVLAYFVSGPLLQAVAPGYRGNNLPVGLAVLLLGGLSLAVRREAVPLLLGLLAMENGAFFAGISIAPGLPLLVELAVATDGLVTAFILGVLTRAVQEHIGSTEVGLLTTLKEGPSEAAQP